MMDTLDKEGLGDIVLCSWGIVLQAGYVTEEALCFKREVLHAIGERGIPLGVDIVPSVR